MSAESDSEKQRFVDGQLFQMTLGAATQRGGVYAAGKTESQRATVHTALREALESPATGYRSPVSDDAHCANIEALAERISARCGPLLRGQRLRIGTAQNALNLYLKYLWCVGRCVEPPHCPFDALVLKEVTGLESERWTKLDSMEQYREWVAAARKQAAAHDHELLAIWELHTYNRILAEDGAVALDPQACHVGDAPLLLLASRGVDPA